QATRQFLTEERAEEQRGHAGMSRERHDEVAVPVESGGALYERLRLLARQRTYEPFDLVVRAPRDELPQPVAHAQLVAEPLLPALLVARKEGFVEPAGVEALDQRLGRQRRRQQA